MSTAKETTNVQEVDVDLKELLGIESDSVMTADEDGTKKDNNFFGRGTPDTTFLDKPVKKEEPVAKTTETPVEPTAPVTDEPAADAPVIEEPKIETTETADDIFGTPGADEGINDTEEKKNKGGRPTSTVSAVKSLVDKGLLAAFDDDKKIEDYSAEDIEELIELNFKQREDKIAQEVPKEFYDQLPEELQDAYAYIANGGKDVKGMLKALSNTVETKDLDPSNDADGKNIIRTYLQATNYGTPEEIEDEIFELEDRGNLEKKANQFKPKLDAMKQQIVNQKIAEQEENAKKRQAQSQQYMESVYGTLEKGELNGVKLDNKMQNMLYAGLVQSNYPSPSGKQTNMLGHLLEKYQWEEPRHDLIAETLWLLADPEGYKNSIRSNVEKEVTEKTMRTLKTEQSASSNASSQGKEEEKSSAPVKRNTVKRGKRNFFGRK